MTQSYRKGITMACAAAAVSGISVWVNAFAAKGINPTVLTGTKNLIVGIVFACAVVLWQRSALRALTMKQKVLLLLVGIIGGGIAFVMFFNGISMTMAARAGLIQKLMFIIVAVLAPFLIRERVTAKIGIGIFALALGQILLSRVTAWSFGMGEWLVLGATVLWAFEIIAVKSLLRSVPVTVIAASRMLIGGCTIALYAAMSGSISAITTLSSNQWAWIAGTAAILVVYMSFLYAGLARLPAHVTMSIVALAAPITVFMDVWFNGKTLVLAGGIGSAVMVIAVVCIALLQRRAAYVLERDGS